MDKTWIEKKKKNNNIKNMWQGLLPFRILVNSVWVCVFVDTRCTWLRRGWWRRRWWCWRCWGDGAPNLEAHWNCATQTQSLWYLLETKKKQKKKKYVNVSSVYDESQSTPVPRQGNSSRLLAQIHSRRSSIEPCQVGGWMNGWRCIHGGYVEMAWHCRVSCLVEFWECLDNNKEQQVYLFDLIASCS